MSIFEYDEELHKKTLLEEGYEEGLKIGLERGRSEGLKSGLERGRSEGKAESILCLLEEWGPVPANVSQTILAVSDEQLLKSLLKIASKVDNIEEYMEFMKEMIK